MFWKNATGEEFIALLKSQGHTVRELTRTLTGIPLDRPAMLGVVLKNTKLQRPDYYSDFYLETMPELTLCIQLGAEKFCYDQRWGRLPTLWY